MATADEILASLDPLLQELLSWPARGEMPDLPERCLACDTPLVIEQEAHGRGSHEDGRYLFWYLLWCHLSCPTCQRTIALSNEVELRSCFGGDRGDWVAEHLAKRQAELRYFTLRHYDRNVRNGWRWFDKSQAVTGVTTRMTAQELRVRFEREFGPVWTPPQV